jgi:hypothetical protein
MKSSKLQIFFDMDGVLCDWEEGVKSLGLASIGEDRVKTDNLFEKIKEKISLFDFYSNLEPFPGALGLLNSLIDSGQNVAILSSLGCKPSEEDREETQRGKIAWLRTHSPKIKKAIFVPGYFLKAAYSGPKKVLFDDKDVVIDNWIEEGGNGVLWTSSTEKQIVEFLARDKRYYGIFHLGGGVDIHMCGNLLGAFIP